MISTHESIDETTAHLLMTEGNRPLLEPVLILDYSVVERVAGGPWHVLAVEGVSREGGLRGGREPFAGTLPGTAGHAHFQQGMGCTSRWGSKGMEGRQSTMQYCNV